MNGNFTDYKIFKLIIGLLFITYFLIALIPPTNSNPDLSFNGVGRTIIVDSDELPISFNNGDVSGYFHEVTYIYIDNVKINDKLYEYIDGISVTINASSKSDSPKLYVFENATLNGYLKNASFSKFNSNHYNIKGNIETTFLKDFNPSHETLFHIPEEKGKIVIGNLTLNKNDKVEFDINENSIIKVYGKADFDIYNPSIFIMKSYITNDIIIKWFTGDLRYKNNYYKIFKPDILHITKSNTKNSNPLIVNLEKNDEIFIQGDVKKLELSDTFVTNWKHLTLIFFQENYGVFTFFVGILNITILLFLVLLTKKYATSTQQIVDETSKEREANLIIKKLEEFYYPSNNKIIGKPIVDNKALMAILKSDIDYQKIFLANDELKSLLKNLFENEYKDLNPDDFVEIPMMIDRDVNILEHRLQVLTTSS